MDKMKDYIIDYQTYEWYTVHLQCFINTEGEGTRNAFVFAKSHEQAMDMVNDKMQAPNNHEAIFRVRSWCTRESEMDELAECLETHSKEDRLSKVLFIPQKMSNEEENDG